MFQEMTLDVSVIKMWSDHRLRYQDGPLVVHIQQPLDNMWVPPINFPTARTTVHHENDGGKETLINIAQSGLVTVTSR